jgi:hypothetical protein
MRNLRLQDSDIETLPSDASIVWLRRCTAQSSDAASKARSKSLEPIDRVATCCRLAYFKMLCAASYLCPPSKPLNPILPSITPYHQLSHIDSIYTSTTIALIVCQPAAMWLLKLLVLLQVLVGLSTATTDFLQPNVSDAQVAKRWFAVPDSQHSVPEENRPWPPRGTMDGLHTRFYCFEDAAAHRIMGDLLPDALDKWEPALKVSSLAFAPDSACTGGAQSQCLCSTSGVEEATVRLRLGVHGAHASIGYYDPFQPIEPGKPRNYIEWPAMQRDTRARAVLELAHELGMIFD